MAPLHLALIDDDAEYTEFLSQYLRDRGMEVDVFADSHDLMALDEPYRYDFYVVDLMLPGIDGVNLIKLLRRRTNAGVLVVSGRLAAEVFREVITRRRGHVPRQARAVRAGGDRHRGGAAPRRAFRLGAREPHGRWTAARASWWRRTARASS